MRRSVGLVLSVGVVAACFPACGDGFSECSETRSCPVEGGGGAGAAGEAAKGEAGGGTIAGDANEPLGGNGNAGNGGNDGGAGAASTADCPDGYSDWLTSSFAFPDGDVIGPADFPSMPWAATGALKIDTGRLSGTGVATVSQGVSFPYNGSRFRFRCRFTDSNQELTVAFDAAKDGSGGVRVEVDGYGRFSLSEGATRVVYADVPPLETGVDWFVETTFQGSSATAVLSRVNYASETGASQETTIKTDALKVTSAGTKTAVSLAANGTSPAIDEISFARCGVKPPDYTALFVDTFERADSTTLGKAELPANATWASSGADAKIVSGGLQVGNLATAHVPLATVPTSGLRIRETVHADASYLWANVSYNAAAILASAIDAAGFWVWNDDTAVYTEIFTTPEVHHVGKTLKPNTSYFVELDRDDSLTTLTVRTGSFSGPIYIVSNAVVGTPKNVGQYLWLGTSSGTQTTSFDDIRIEAYEAQ